MPYVDVVGDPPCPSADCYNDYVDTLVGTADWDREGTAGISFYALPYKIVADVVGCIVVVVFRES